MSFDFDLFVIGGGSGGVRAGRIAAQHGAKVGLAEEFRMGGTCVIRGCVPKKLMVYASHFAESFEEARGFGWEIGETRFDWPGFMAAKQAEITRLEAAYTRNLEAAGATAFAARATITGPHEVTLSTGEILSAAHILVATGGWPFVPDIPGRELAMTSNEILDLPDLPKRLAVVGGGYIASEFACIFNGLGVDVHQVYRGDQILRGFDGDVRTQVSEDMARKGVTFHLGANVTAIEKVAAGVALSLDTGETLEADHVLYATGRVPNSTGLGLEAQGVALGQDGAIVVDSWSQTRIPSIYAVGDVTDRIQLTPVAIREGHAFADTLFGNKPWRADHEAVASAVFTQPEIGTVGLTEEEARESHDIEVYRTQFRAMAQSFAGSDQKTLMKLVVDRETRRVLGVHLVGAAAGEMIQMVAIAVKMGATKEEFDATVAVHPTAAEELVTMRQPVVT